MSVELLGKKIGMTQVFDKYGRALAATVLEVGPCRVTKILTTEKNGYSAVQLGFGQKKEKSASSAYKGQFKQWTGYIPEFVREVRTPVLEGLEVGKELKVDLFRVREKVDIIGTSIGRGFQGVVKRHHFKGGPRSHGSMFGRVGGSIGSNTFPGRVLKGVGMPGHMGNCRTTQQNVKVLDVVPEQNLMVVLGSVPGPENRLLEIRLSLKQGLPRANWNVPEPLPEIKEEPKETKAAPPKEEKVAKKAEKKVKEEKKPDQAKVDKPEGKEKAKG